MRGPSTTGGVDEAVQTFSLLNDSTRLRLLTGLMPDDGRRDDLPEKFVNEMCAEVNASQPSVSHHLALLRASGIVAYRKSGKHYFYRLTDFGLTVGRMAVAVMAEFVGHQ